MTAMRSRWIWATALLWACGTDPSPQVISGRSRANPETGVASDQTDAGANSADAGPNPADGGANSPDAGTNANDGGLSAPDAGTREPHPFGTHGAYVKTGVLYPALPQAQLDSQTLAMYQTWKQRYVVPG